MTGNQLRLRFRYCCIFSNQSFSDRRMIASTFGGQERLVGNVLDKSVAKQISVGGQAASDYKTSTDEIVQGFVQCRVVEPGDLL